MPERGCGCGKRIGCNDLLHPLIQTKNRKTVIMSPKAKRIARRLLRENRGTRSKPGRAWRTIACERYGDKINHATLCRFAISEGEWAPKNKRLLIVLGLKSERKP